MEKMSEVSRVKTYKKGSKWVSSLMVTAGVGALALSAGSLSANADTVAANHVSNNSESHVASVATTSAAKSSNTVALKSSANNSSAKASSTASSAKASSTQSSAVASSKASSASVSSETESQKAADTANAAFSQAQSDLINAQNKEQAAQKSYNTASSKYNADKKTTANAQSAFNKAKNDYKNTASANASTNVATSNVNSGNVQTAQKVNVQNGQHTDTTSSKNIQPKATVERFNTTASKVAGQQQNSKQNNMANTGNSYAVKPNNLANSNQLSIQGAYCNALNTINVALNHQMSGDLKSQIQFSNGGGIKSVTQNGNMLTITTNQDMDFQNKMEIRIPSQNIVYDVREEIGKDMGVVRTAAFDNKYTYNGNDLGVTYTPTRSTFKIWAPTASAIEVNTYENDTDPNSKAKNHYSMKYVGQGVWEVTVQGDLNNTAYDYTIHFADGATNETYDPYATACVEGGYRSVVLAPSETGANVSSIGKDDPTNEVIGEIHIRDFTNNPSSII